MNKAILLVVALFAVGIFAQAQTVVTYQAEESYSQDMRYYSFSRDLYGAIQLTGPQPEMIKQVLIPELERLQGVRRVDAVSPRVLNVVKEQGFEWGDVESRVISRIKILVPSLMQMRRLPDIAYKPPVRQPLPFPLPMILGAQKAAEPVPAPSPPPKLEPPQAPRPRTR